MIRLIVMFTVLGFLAITVGPVILGIFVAILPFALVGFAIWLGIQTLHHGPRVVGEHIHGVGEDIYAHAHRVAGLPAHVGARFGQAVRGVGYGIARLVRFVVGFVSPVLGGALVGGFLGAAGGLHYHDMAVRLPVGLLIGGLIGLSVAILWRRAEAKPIVLQTADHHTV